MNMMNKKILGAAIAAIVAAPLAAQADVKLSGAIQAEIGSIEISGGDRFTNSSDRTGALYGGGPNRFGFDFDEDLGGGLKAYGRIDWAFHTSYTGSTGSSLSDREQYLGLKGSSGAYLRAGRIQGAYKTATKIDPFAATSGQMRIGGGESSGAFSHGAFLNNVFEIGFNNSGFKFALQGIFDEVDGAGTGISDDDGSYLANVEYGNDKFTVFGAYADRAGMPNDSDVNWKIGGKATFGGLTVGLQYEDTEMNQAPLAPSSSGEYITGSASYKLGNVVLGGWVSQYSDDTGADRDAISFAAGAIYLFSKRTLAYAAYHSIDVDNTDVGDLSAFAAGIRHSF
jgi:predicted porin